MNVSINTIKSTVLLAMLWQTSYVPSTKRQKLSYQTLEINIASLHRSHCDNHGRSPLSIVWCGMSEKCLKLKVLAKIDFIAFLASLGVK